MYTLHICDSFDHSSICKARKQAKVKIKNMDTQVLSQLGQSLMDCGHRNETEQWIYQEYSETETNGRWEKAQ